MKKEALAFCLAAWGGSLVGCQNNFEAIPTETPTILSTVTAETTLTATPIFSPTPKPTATAMAIPTLQPEDTLYYKFRNRIEVISKERRQKQKQANPDKFARQIDPSLENIGPTFLILGCGPDNVAYGNHRQMVCPNSEIILADQIKRFILTHDTAFPVEPGRLVRSDELWLKDKGNFSALRDGWQDATHAPVDFIVVINDYTAFANLVRTAFGGKLKINNPIAFTAQGIWDKNGKLTPEYPFEQGELILNPDQTLQYLASTPNQVYDPAVENHNRVQNVLEGMWAEMERQRQAGDFRSLGTLIFSSASFLTDQVKSGNITTDSDIVWLVGKGLETVGQEIVASTISRKSFQFSQGKLLANPLYLLDPAISPTKTKGLRWGAKSDPYMERYIQSNLAPENYYAIPDWNDLCQEATEPEKCGANFYTNHPERDYWLPVSNAFKSYLLRQ